MFFFTVLNAVATINSAIDKGNAEDTVLALSNKDAKLPAVLRQPVNLYQSELLKFKQANDGVSTSYKNAVFTNHGYSKEYKFILQL